MITAVTLREEQPPFVDISYYRRRRFELFYYEQVGTRYYLRFTRLALILVVCLTVIPAAAIFALFLTQSHADLENVNVNVTVPSRTPSNYGGADRHAAATDDARCAEFK